MSLELALSRRKATWRRLLKALLELPEGVPADHREICARSGISTLGLAWYMRLLMREGCVRRVRVFDRMLKHYISHYEVTDRGKIKRLLESIKRRRGDGN